MRTSTLCAHEFVVGLASGTLVCRKCGLTVTQTKSPDRDPEKPFKPFKPLKGQKKLPLKKPKP
jgi:hypothetical protein